MKKGIIIALVMILSVICSVAHAEPEQGQADSVDLGTPKASNDADFESCLTREYDMDDLVSLPANHRIRQLIAQYIVCSAIEKEDESLCRFSPVGVCLEGSPADCNPDMQAAEDFYVRCKNMPKEVSKVIFPLLSGDRKRKNISHDTPEDWDMDKRTFKKEVRAYKRLVESVWRKNCKKVRDEEKADFCQALVSKDIVEVLTNFFGDKVDDSVHSWVLFRDIPQMYGGEKDVCKKIYKQIKREYCIEISNK